MSTTPQGFISKGDEARFAACGWPSELRDEEMLERLLALNLEIIQK